jgi:hypothetical protein
MDRSRVVPGRSPGFGSRGPSLKASTTPGRRVTLHSGLQGETLIMRYMDVSSGTPNGKTAVVLLGKNFCAATWGLTIKALADEGIA